MDMSTLIGRMSHFQLFGTVGLYFSYLFFSQIHVFIERSVQKGLQGLQMSYKKVDSLIGVKFLI